MQQFTFEPSDVLEFFQKNLYDTSDQDIRSFLGYLSGETKDRYELTSDEEEELDDELRIIENLTNDEINMYRQQIEAILNVDEERINLRNKERNEVDPEDLITFFIEEGRYTPGRGIFNINMARDFWIWLGYDPDEVKEFGHDTLISDVKVFDRILKKRFPLGQEPEISFESEQLHEYFVTHLGHDAKTITLSVEDYNNLVVIPKH